MSAAARVLVVDDAVPFLHALSHMLRADGGPAVAIEAAASVSEAIARIERAVPDIVVTDIRLGPGGDGWALCAEIRRRWPQIPVIVQSAWLNTEDQRLARALEVELIDKGRDLTALVAAVARQCMAGTD